MIERLLIQNFQAHDKLKIDFDPGITSIVGPSDAGKSAILRALRWAATNQPGGGAFVRQGTPGATVRLMVDGHTITRRRNATGDVNEYALDGQTYRAFGRGVPEPIERLLNIGDVCWQGQHDAPYWFANTAGEVSRQLNAIVNLGIIDDTMANVARAVHRARTKLDIAEEELTNAKTAYGDTAWVPEFEAALSAVEEIENKADETAERAALLAEVVGAIQAHTARLAVATDAAQAGEVMAEAGGYALHTAERLRVLTLLVDRVHQLEEQLAVPVPHTEAIEAAFERYTTARTRAATISRLIQDVHTKEETLCQANENLDKAEREMPKVCPVCGQSL